MPDVPVVPETANAEIVAPAPTPEPAAEPQAVPAESAPAQDETPKTPEDTGPEPEGESKAVQELKAQRRKRQEAEQEAAYWKAKATEQAPKPEEPQQVQPDPEAPRIEQFENYDDYVVARTKYEIRKEEQTRKETERQAELDRGYGERFKKAAENIPDLAETISSARISMPQPMIEAIKDSDIGPELAYHLAKNPDEALRLSQQAKINPWSAMKELGKLEMKLKMPVAPAQTRQVTQAPEPIRPVGTGTAGPDKNFDEMSTAEFIARRNAQTFSRVGGRLVPKV